MLGINRKSKYVKAGFENRRKYDNFLKLHGTIKIGETVCCGASPEAVVTAIATDGSITVKLLPFGTEKIYQKIRTYS